MLFHRTSFLLHANDEPAEGRAARQSVWACLGWAVLRIQVHGCRKSCVPCVAPGVFSAALQIRGLKNAWRGAAHQCAAWDDRICKNAPRRHNTDHKREPVHYQVAPLFESVVTDWLAQTAQKTRQWADQALAVDTVREYPTELTNFASTGWGAALGTMAAPVKTSCYDDVDAYGADESV
jgi:hypothetical protein